MNNTYDEEARKFLRTHNIKLTINEASLQTAAPWADGSSGTKYECVMTSERGAYRFNFWGSVAQRQGRDKPTAYDVLACLDIWEGTIDEFVDEFGYSDTPVSKVLETYNAVIDQNLQLKHILSTEALADLAEIN